MSQWEPESETLTEVRCKKAGGRDGYCGRIENPQNRKRRGGTTWKGEKLSKEIRFKIRVNGEEAV